MAVGFLILRPIRPGALPLVRVLDGIEVLPDAVVSHVLQDSDFGSLP